MTDEPVEREPDTSEKNFANATLKDVWSSVTATLDPPPNGKAKLNGNGYHDNATGATPAYSQPVDDEADARARDALKAAHRPSPRHLLLLGLYMTGRYNCTVRVKGGEVGVSVDLDEWAGCPAPKCHGPVITSHDTAHCTSCGRGAEGLVAIIRGSGDLRETIKLGREAAARNATKKKAGEREDKDDKELAEHADWLAQYGKASAAEAGEEWVEVLPREGSWPRPMGRAARHGLIGEAVDLIEPHTESDPHSVLISLLVAFGNLIGRGPGFMAEESFHATNLYAVIVGDSSKARKGTSWGPVNRLALLADPEYKSHIVGGLSSGEGVVWAVRDPVVKRVAVKEGKPPKPTGEYVDEVEDPGVDDKRLLVREGEFARCLKVMGRQGNTLSSTLRALWDDGSGGGLTKNEPTKCTDALVSILGHITRNELGRELTDTDAANGFGNRFLWSCAQRSKLLPDGSALPAADVEALGAKFREAVTFARRLKVPLYRDDEARSLWHQVYADLSEGQDGLVGALTARAEAQVMRVAVIYAVLDERTEVGAEHLRAALEVWRYCEESAAHVFGRATGDTTADEIMAALRSSGEEGMSRWEVNDLFSGHRSSEQIGAALTALEKTGQARMQKVPTGGRPTERWFAA
jgi:uncharacterized protein DUF3987